MADKLWHYLEINRGRYLCLEHGSFCDSSDGHIAQCPLCESNNNWQINEVSRTLQIIKNLQARSIRIISLLSGVTGLLGLFSFFERDDIALYWAEFTWLSKLFIVLFIGCFLLSFLSYLWSIAHIKTTKSSGLFKFWGVSNFPKKTLREWEEHIVKYLARFERRHQVGKMLLLFSGVSLIAFLLKQFILI